SDTSYFDDPTAQPSGFFGKLFNGGRMFDPTNPNTSALLSMAAALGQAGMPTRLPVPFGAALLQSLGAAQQGGTNAYKAQLERAQAQSAKANAFLDTQFVKNYPAMQDALAGLSAPEGSPTATFQKQVAPSLPQSLPTPSQAPKTISPGAYAALVSGGENATGNPAATPAPLPGQTTPPSSAVGDGQFTNDTWLGLVKKYRPDLVNGQSDQQILALRSDPNLSRQMIAAYAQDNTPKLASAGITPNAATLAMAHRYGPQGATAVLTAQPDAKLETVLSPHAIAANPTWKGQTAGDVTNNFMNRYGVLPVSDQQQAAPTAPTAPAAPTSAPLLNIAKLARVAQIYSMNPRTAGLAGQLWGMVKDKMPAGYRLNQDGTLGPIPGGPADPTVARNLKFNEQLGTNLQTQGPNGVIQNAPGAVNAAAEKAGATKGAEAWAGVAPAIYQERALLPDKILAQAADYAMRPEPLGPTQSMQSGFAALPEPMQRRILELFNPAGAAALPPPNATQGAAQGAAPPVANVAANNTAPAAPAAPATPGFNPLKSSGAGSVPARMTPAQESAEADLGKEFATKESDSYEAANKAQIELGNMLNS